MRKRQLIDLEQATYTGKGAGKTELFSSILDQKCKLRIRVTGTSMAPFIKNDDVVTVQKCPIRDLRIGDLVLCRHQDDAMTLHRLIKIRKRGVNFNQWLIVTKGDANNSYDPAVDGTAYMGKVVDLRGYRYNTITKKNMLNRSAVFTNFLIGLYFRIKLKGHSVYGHYRNSR
jgi:signal peptidase I